MQHTQKELARRFATGADSGAASNMSIVPDDELGKVTHLVAYGWAVYATHHQSGEIVVYREGWSEWARERGGRATQSQLAEVRKGIREALGGVDPEDHALVTHSADTPTVAEPPDSVSLVGRRTMTR